MYYAIEIIGYGKRRRFCIKQVFPNKLVIPTNRKTYPTETAARKAAAEMEIKIEKCGDFYEII